MSTTSILKFNNCVILLQRKKQKQYQRRNKQKQKKKDKQTETQKDNYEKGLSQSAVHQLHPIFNSSGKFFFKGLG